jgi:hypothetical protein
METVNRSWWPMYRLYIMDGNGVVFTKVYPTDTTIAVLTAEMNLVHAMSETDGVTLAYVDYPNGDSARETVLHRLGNEIIIADG